MAPCAPSSWAALSVRLTNKRRGHEVSRWYLHSVKMSTGAAIQTKLPADLLMLALLAGALLCIAYANTCTRHKCRRDSVQCFCCKLITSSNLKASPTPNLLLGKQGSYYVFKWSPIRANFTVCLEAVCCSNSNRSDFNCSADRKQIHSFLLERRIQSRSVFLQPPRPPSPTRCYRLLCSPSSFITSEWEETVNSIHSLSPSLVDVSQCTQLLSPSISFSQ